MTDLDLRDDDVAAVLEAAREGQDPLGIAALDMAGALNVVLEALAGADRRMAEEIARHIPGAYRIKDAAVDWRAQTPIDALTADLMAHIGVDPLAATWISIHAGAFNVSSPNTGYRLAQVDGTGAGHPMNLSCCAIGDGAEWRTFGEIRTRTLIPETIAIATHGRLLRDVVSHPVLDRHLLRVVDIGRDALRTIITTDHEAVPATTDELLGRGPHGCR